jgi:hypothetical protein
MVQLLHSWRFTLRCEWQRRQLQRRLLDVVARLPYEPESRCTYQALLDEQLRLARVRGAVLAAWHGSNRAGDTD